MDKTRIEIPKDAALQLCTELRQKYRGEWWTLAGMQCMGCITASKGDLAKVRVSSAPGYRGCDKVNPRYDRHAKKAS